MLSDPPKRPAGDTIEISDPDALRAWAAWLEIEPAGLVRIVGILGPAAGQIEFLLGKSDRSRW